MLRVVLTLHDAAHTLNLSHFLLMSCFYKQMLRNVFLSPSPTPKSLLDTPLFHGNNLTSVFSGSLVSFLSDQSFVRSSQLSVLFKERRFPSIHLLASNSPGPQAPHVPTVTLLIFIVRLLLRSLDFQIQQRRRIGHVSAFTEERAFQLGDENNERCVAVMN